MKYKCLSCGIEFKKQKDTRAKNKFCSSKCALVPCRTKEHQIKAGKKAGVNNILRLRGTGNKTYVKEYGRHQHRVVMERKLGRKLKKGEIVHHIDHNKKNNNPENLQIMTQSEHARLHSTKYGPECVVKECLNKNRKGYKYCSKHATQIYRHNEII